MTPGGRSAERLAGQSLVANCIFVALTLRSVLTLGRDHTLRLQTAQSEGLAYAQAWPKQQLAMSWQLASCDSPDPWRALQLEHCKVTWQAYMDSVAASRHVDAAPQQSRRSAAGNVGVGQRLSGGEWQRRRGTGFASPVC